MSTLYSRLTDPTGVDPYPAWGALTAAWIGLPWRVQLAGGPAAVRSVLRGVVMLAEQAAELSDEQLRTRLGGWVR